MGDENEATLISKVGRELRRIASPILDVVQAAGDFILDVIVIHGNRSFKRRAKLKVLFCIAFSFSSLYAIVYGLTQTPRIIKLIRAHSRTMKILFGFVIFNSLTNFATSKSKGELFADITLSCSILASILDEQILWRTMNGTMMSLLLLTLLASWLPRCNLGMFMAAAALDGLVVSFIVYIIPTAFTNQERFSVELWYKSLIFFMAGILFDDLQSIFLTINLRGMSKDHIFFTTSVTFGHCMLLFYMYSCLLTTKTTP